MPGTIAVENKRMNGEGRRTLGSVFSGELGNSHVAQKGHHGRLCKSIIRGEVGHRGRSLEKVTSKESPKGWVSRLGLQGRGVEPAFEGRRSSIDYNICGECYGKHNYRNLP